MEEKQFYQLLRKYRSGKATKKEIDLLNAYYDLFEVQPDGLAGMDDAKAESLKQMMKAGIDQHIDALGKHGRRPPYFRLLWVAASVVILAAVGAVFYYETKQHEALSEKYARYDIRPGKKSVVLTLANGKKITIRPSMTGQLAMQGSVILAQHTTGVLVYENAGKIKDQAVQYNSISIPDGTEFELILPDGSKAFLNANSSLRYPTVFADGKRMVELEGEGYFEITHNKAKPFVVKTFNQQVEVLGTHFNVNAYSDEGITKTTLLEGSVKVSSGNQSLLLHPGEQSQVPSTSVPLQIGMVAAADTDQAVAWKNGFFQYHEADIKAIMRDFSRWYGVKVVYEGNIHERLFSGAIHKNLSLLQALDLLHYANVHFTIENKQITISNN